MTYGERGGRLRESRGRPGRVGSNRDTGLPIRPPSAGVLLHLFFYSQFSVLWRLTAWLRGALHRCVLKSGALIPSRTFPRDPALHPATAAGRAACTSVRPSPTLHLPAGATTPGEAGQGSGRWSPALNPLAFLSPKVLARRRGNAPAHSRPRCGSGVFPLATAPAAAFIRSLYFWLLGDARQGCVLGWGGLSEVLPHPRMQAGAEQGFEIIPPLTTETAARHAGTFPTLTCTLCAQRSLSSLVLVSSPCCSRVTESLRSAVKAR